MELVMKVQAMDAKSACEEILYDSSSIISTIVVVDTMVMFLVRWTPEHCVLVARRSEGRTSDRAKHRNQGEVSLQGKDKYAVQHNCGSPKGRAGRGLNPCT